MPAPTPRSLAAAAAAVLTVGALLLSACTAPTPSGPAPSATGVAASGDFAGLVEVGTRKLYLECRGSGSPTVVLQAGFGNAADIWSYTEAQPPPVYPGTATFSRVCAYDRPGSTRLLDDDGKPAASPLPSRSDPAPMPRSGTDVVTELHDLLAAAGVPGPYVLVGHSLGGLFQLLYARSYPDQLAGLVLIDATSPALKELLTPQQWQQIAQAPLLEPQTPIKGYVVEAYNLDQILAQLAAAPELRQQPAAVLAAAGLQPGAPPELVKIMKPLMPKAQAALAASIPGAKFTTVPDTTHYIQVQRPDVVIDSIRTVRSP